MLILNYEPASSVNADGVKLMDIDPETGERRNLSRAINGKLRSGYILWRPGYYAFSPNGKYLLMTLGVDRQEVTNKRLVRVEYATGKRLILTSAKMASFDARWSPDGKHIAYIAIPDPGWVSSDKELSYEQQVKHQHLYLMTTDGHNKRRLTQDTGYCEEEPACSADGRKLFFVRHKITDDWPRSLWTIRPDGTGLTCVRSLPSKEE